MKKLLIMMIIIIITPTLFAQQANKPPTEEIQWGTNVEITYTHLKEDKLFGWYIATEHGARFAPSNTIHLALLESGIVYHPKESTTITLIGVGGEYNFNEKKMLLVLNSAVESKTLGIGVKGIFEDGVNIEVTAIKFFTLAHHRFAFGGGYIFKKQIPLLKITIPFEHG